MEQLLDIKYVPISFEMKIHKAKLEESSDFTLHRNVIDNRFLTPYTPKLCLDKNEFKSGTNLYSNLELNKYYENYQSILKKSTANTAKEEKGVMSTQNSYNSLHDFAFEHADSSLKSAVGVSLLPINFNMNSEQLKNQYEIDRQSYDWIAENKPKVKFTPASVEFLVKEYAHLEVKFLGKPQYVPPSASPDYKPPELNVSA